MCSHGREGKEPCARQRQQRERSPVVGEPESWPVGLECRDGGHGGSCTREAGGLDSPGCCKPCRIGVFCPKLVGSHQQVIFEADWCQKCPLWARPLGVLAVQR